MQERSKSFITKEKLDGAIEFALSNPVDYNFALDIQGNMYSGRASTEPIDGSNVKVGESEKQLSTG